MIGQTKQFIFFCGLFVAAALPYSAQEQPEQLTNAAKRLGEQIAAARTDAERTTLIDARSIAELNQLCSVLIQDKLLGRRGAPVFPLAVSAALIRKIAAKTEDADCRGYALIENANRENNGYEVSLKHLQQALALFESTGNKKNQIYALGLIHNTYRAQSDYEAALASCLRAIKLSEEINDHVEVVELKNAAGATKMYQGDFAAGEKLHLEALHLAEDTKYLPGVANSTFHLGIIYRARGNYTDSLRFYQRSRLNYEIVVKQSPEVFDGPLTTCLRHIGSVYYLQGSNRLALEYFHKSLALDEARKDKSAIAYSLLSIARVRFAEKDYPETARLADKILQLYREVGDKEGTALALNLTAYTEQRLGNYERALEFFKQSLQLREATGSRDGAAVVRTGMASVYQSLEQHRAAVDFATKAAAQFEQSGNRELLWQAQTIAGKSWRALGEREHARRSFDGATGVIEALRRDATGGENERGVFFAGKVEPYQQTALMFAEQNNAAEAFAASERAKARVLLDVLRFGRAELAARLTDREHEQENRLRNEIAALNAQISRLNPKSSGAAGQQADLQKRLEKVRLEYADFQACMYADHPELQLQRGAVAPVAAAQVADLLDEKSAFLEYLVAGDETLLFVFTKNAGKLTLNVHRLPVKRADLSRQIAAFRQKLASANLLFSGDARALHDALLRPAREQLKDKKNLVIVPDDGLWELPFQALQSAENYYLLDDFAVSYAPSLTVLRELRARGDRAATKNLLAVGNPAAQRGENAKINYAALPEAERQVHALRQLFGAGGSSTVLTGAAAGENVFKREAAAYAVVHLATHGVLDNNNPLASYVLLSSSGQAGEDGRLEARELLEMNLNAEMVVLSACETARGESRAGEGMIGLAWSLMVAGTRTVGVSQWKVESASTTDLMTEFYRSLKTGAKGGKAESLREAAQKLRRSERFSHPFYWAGFVLIGENN